MAKAPTPIVNSNTGLGCMVEVINLAREMREPEDRFPPTPKAGLARAFDPIPRRFRCRVSALAFRRARGETGDVVVDQEGVSHGDWDGPEKPRGHQRAPEVEVCPDQVTDHSNRYRFHVA
jgi:hypothetical protein